MTESSITPVAVIGMACRLPGGVGSPAELWQALLRGEDFVTKVPLDRWDAEDFYDPEPGIPGRSISKWGAFLDDPIGFDADFFGINEREATSIDPQHRLLLESSWEAVEHAGIDPSRLAGSLTGVFLGLTHNDYQMVAADADTLAGPYGFTGTNFSLASGRIAYALGALGPALTIDSACSSSLLAVHMAARSLRESESDLALAGGACMMFDPQKMAAGSAQGMLSPTGRCHAFDVSADGFVSGEGVAMVLLKRLSDAERDGDRVLAVIRGTAANQDGRTVNIATPSEDAQTAVYRAALRAADVDPDTVGMVEAHGTGTPVGDPIEFASLAAVYGKSGQCALGSVKTNLGHAQSASGVIGLIKTVLSLQTGTVPPNLHFTALPEPMARIETGLAVPTERWAWPTNGAHPRRAAVSSYGLSGTNVHAVLEQAPTTRSVATDGTGPWLFPVSSTSADELRRTAGRLANWVGQQEGADLADLAYTLTRRRAHRSVRGTVAAANATELIAGLREVAEGETVPDTVVAQDDRGPVWLFSGQGSQWAGMGTELLVSEPVFAATIAELEPLIAAESGFSVTAAISDPDSADGIDRIQPTLFAMQVALAAALRSRGARPGAVIGHSMGEVAAAVVAEALSLIDGVRVICRRSRLMSTIAGSGAMAAVELPAQRVLSELSARGINDVVISVISSPQSTVVGGATESVRELVAAWTEQGVLAREVAVDVASHSPQVDPILDDLAEALDEITPLEPSIPYYSATLYDPRDEPYVDADYWIDNLRHAVRFSAAVQAAVEDGFRVFGELAPHPLLVHPTEHTARGLDVPVAALPAMRRAQEMPHGLLEFIGDLHCAGAGLDLDMLAPNGNLVDAPLPTWTHRPLLVARDGRDVPTAGGHLLSVHPLLGAHVLLPEEPERHVWQSDAGTAAQPWLADHKVHNVAALPGAAYCEMALSVGASLLDGSCEVRDIEFEQLLLLDEETLVSTVATVSGPGRVEFLVETAQQGVQIRRAVGTVEQTDAAEPAPRYDLAELSAAHQHRIDGADLRKWFDNKGIQYGPAFSGLAAAYVGAVDEPVASVFAEVSLPGAIRSQQGAYAVHPALLDVCFQAIAGYGKSAAESEDPTGLLLPLGVQRLRAYATTKSAHFCYLRVTGIAAAEVHADLDLLDEHGAVLLRVQGLRLGTGMSEAAQRDRVFNERLLTIDWQHREAPQIPAAGPGKWLLIAPSVSDRFTGNLAAALELELGDVTTMVWPAGADHPVHAAQLRGHFVDESYSGVVVLTDDQPAASPITAGQQHVQRVVHIVRELAEIVDEPPRLYVLTNGAQVVLPEDVVNLDQAGLRGLIRVLSAEQAQLRPTVIDLGADPGVDRNADQVAHQLLSDSAEDETAWRAGAWYTARLSATPLTAQERRHRMVDLTTDAVRLQIRTPGDISTMELAAVDRTAPGPGRIEVKVNAANINFDDVRRAFGQYPSGEHDGDDGALGTDFAGIITAVGPDVTDHRVGDRVAGMASGTWGTFVTCPAESAVVLPDGVPLDQAAAVPTAHATAWYALHDLARISKRDKVLIHSAAGGVGRAAIAIAQSVGAEIYATAGSLQRRELLHGIGIEHVYDSRSADFAEQIRTDTEGYGVDVVLNSLSGSAQRAGLELLAAGGRFVEIGKQDINTDAKLRRNLSLHTVDMAALSATRPDEIHRLLTLVFNQIAAGELPLPQTTNSCLTDCESAIALMGGAEPVGRLVLDIPADGVVSAVVAPEHADGFRSDGAYLVSGGLGGLGLFLAERMAESGAGRLVLGARREPGADVQAVLERIRSQGTEVEVVLGDIADPVTADRMMAAATAAGHRVRGVLHAAAVVEDATLANITDELIARDWAPKVGGAWNLHRATESVALDWFCSFSSAAALVGSPGQGAYAAANSWLDGFTRWRRSRGLPATVIAWGAWSRIGKGADFAEISGVAITPEEGAHAFDTLLRYDRGYTGYAPLNGAPWLAEFAKRSPFAEAFRSADTEAEASGFRCELAATPREEWASKLRRLVSEQIGQLLRRSIDPDRALAEYGIDSLGNLELRTRIEAETGLRIGPADITTVRGLADKLCQKLIADEDAELATST